VTVVAYDELSTIRVEVDGGVVWAAIDHPPMNLWDRALTTDLVALILGVEADEDARVLVLTSADPEYFVAHADVTMLIEMQPEEWGGKGDPAPVNTLLERLRLMPKVTIAAVNGLARGGGSELALACDLRFAARSARLGQPEVALGLIPGAGGTQRLTRLVGRARALEIIVGCHDVTADEAAAIGYVNRAVDDAELQPLVSALAHRIASMSPDVVARAKRAVEAASGDPIPGFAVEAAEFRGTLDEPARALMRAFLDAGGQTRDGELDLDVVLERMTDTRER
jgi:enoyl-CoA hydratase/carnithine racemase